MTDNNPDPGFKLGQRVTVTGRLVRVKRQAMPTKTTETLSWLDSYEIKYDNHWEERPYPDRDRHGFITGKRTFSDGEVIYFGDDDAPEYRPTKHFPVYLVVLDIRSNPIFCLPSQIKPVVWSRESVVVLPESQQEEEE